MWTTRAVWTARTTATTPRRWSPAQRLRIRRRIERLALQSPLGPNAILIVRALNGPLCGRELQRRLDAAGAGAVRPTRNRSAAANAPAVWFLDLAEMLACLLDDLLHRQQHQHWWWRNVISRLPHPLTIDSIVLAHAASLPAVFEVLAGVSQDRSVVEALSEDTAIAATRRMLLAHGASAAVAQYEVACARELRRTLAEVPNPVDSTGFTSSPSTTLTRDRIDRSSFPNRALLALATILRRTPARLSSPAFVDAVLTDVAGISTRGMPRRALDTRPIVREVATVASSPDGAPPLAESSDHDADLPAPTHAVPGPSSTPADDVADREDTTSHASRMHHMARADARDDGVPGPTALPSDVTPRERVSPQRRRSAVPHDERFHTRLGGALYLINVFDQIDARGPEPIQWPDEGNRWYLLAAITRHLVRLAGRNDEDDELWRALGILSHDEAAAVDESWMARTAAHVVSFAARALSIDEADVAALCETLLTVRARIHVAPLHVDMVAPLDEIRLPVRLAGFDLDPGWVPRWGRVVQFHFGEWHGGLQ